MSKAGRTKEAAEEFEAGAGLLKAQGRFDDYVKVAERLLYHRPDDVSIARELAEIYLERQDPKRALSKLQLCFKADPKHIPTLELLASAFHQLDQIPKTVSVYKEVARIHQEAGRTDDRAKILKRILELDPQDREARQGLASYAGSGAAPRRDIQPPASAVVDPTAPTETAGQAVSDSAAAPSGTATQALDDDEPMIVEDEVELLDDEEEILIVEDDVDFDDSEFDEADFDDVEEEVIEDLDVVEMPRSIPPDVQREAQIARLLTECDVFLRYGLKQKVLEQLHAVLEIEPTHVEARERLKDLYIADGRLDDAVDQLMSLAELLADGAERSRDALSPPGARDSSGAHRSPRANGTTRRGQRSGRSLVAARPPLVAARPSLFGSGGPRFRPRRPVHRRRRREHRSERSAAGGGGRFHERNPGRTHPRLREPGRPAPRAGTGRRDPTCDGAAAERRAQHSQAGPNRKRRGAASGRRSS